ncbi:MAG: EAL domain-containing protein [Acidiferrobacteraceae bacterium]
MNRAVMQRTLESTFEDSRKHGRGLAVILFSIDRFRLVNSRFGYRGADSVLRKIGQVARAAVGPRGRVGQWNGDEFLCVLRNGDLAMARETAETLRRDIESVVVPVDAAVTNVTASFGIACYPHDGNQLHVLLVAADEALHEAKRLGRNRVRACADLEQPTLTIGSILESALREERVIAAYQPIVDLRTGAIVGEEALARIVTPDGQIISAEKFVDVATEFQLTHRIDRMIVLSAFERYAMETGDNGLTRFINLSGDLLRHPALLAELVRTIKTHCQPNGELGDKSIVIEVTERELLANMEAAREILAPFIDMGLKLALDDFGSGYSSFQYLADLPISFLKIDGGLIRRLDEPKVRAIVRGIQNVAGELGLTTLAEYIETERQADFLRRIGVNWGQGHYYGRALLNEQEAALRRSLSVSWTGGYYCQTPAPSKKVR